MNFQRTINRPCACLVLALLAAVIAGCAVGPNYQATRGRFALRLS